MLDLIVSGVTSRRAILRTLAKAHLEGKLAWGPKLAAGSNYMPDAGADPDRAAAFVAACVSLRTVDIYIARALAELQAIADEHRAIAKGKARARYEKALAGAVSAKEWDIVRKVNRDLVRLDGLEPVGRMLHTHDGTVTAEVSGTVDHVHRTGSLEERAAEITDLFTRAATRRAQAAAQQAAAAN